MSSALFLEVLGELSLPADEELFATRKVFFVGQMLGMILAESELIARRAARLVKVEYEKLPTVFTIEVKALYLIAIPGSD